MGSTSRLCGAVACSAGLLVCPSPTRADAQDESRHVYITVLDAAGAPVTGLLPQHFAVRESGRDRTVLTLEPLQEPMHLAVLVDTSASNGVQNETFRSAVIAFVERQAAFNDIALYAFGDRATSVVPFTRDPSRLRAGALTMFGWSHQRSNLIDAIDLALADLGRIETARPVILAITSDNPEASSRTAGSVTKKLIAQSVAFHAVSLATSEAPGRTIGISNDFEAGSRALRHMAEAGEGDRERTQALQSGTTATGGGWQRLTSPMALGPALDRVARELAGGYRLSFARPGRDRVKDLQVGVLIEGVTLRATAAPFGTR